MNHDLTIVIPAFRCSAYLEPAVCSAVRANPAKVLIAEDGSGDETLAVAERIAERFRGRVQLRANASNLGMTRNWQQALASVDTEFALKLDGDDILSPAYAGYALEFLRGHPAVGIVGAGKKDIHAEEFRGEYIEDWLHKGAAVRAMVLTGADACRGVIRWEPYPCSSSTMYRMSAWRDAGGFDERLGWCSDREIWFRVAEQHAIAFLDCQGVLYRHHDGSVTSATARGKRFARELEIMFAGAHPRWHRRGCSRLFRRAWLWTSRVYAGAVLRSLQRREYLEALEMAGGSARCLLRVPFPHRCTQGMAE